MDGDQHSADLAQQMIALSALQGELEDGQRRICWCGHEVEEDEDHPLCWPGM